MRSLYVLQSGVPLTRPDQSACGASPLRLAAICPRQHLPAVMDVQAMGHPVEYHEGEEAITSRITAPGAIALGAFSKHGDLVAYAIGHPCAGDPPPLSRPVCPSRIPDAGSAPYALLHDLCVLPEWRGGGLGRALAYAWMSAAAGKGAFEAVRLVAVARRDAFWRRLGFEPVEDLAVQRTVAESYGDNAVVMERPFA